MSNIELEQAIIAHIILNNFSLLEFSGITQEYFEDSLNQKIFTSILDLQTQRKTIDIGTLLADLNKNAKVTDKEYFIICISKTSIYRDTSNISSQLVENYKKRQLKTIFSQYNFEDDTQKIIEQINLDFSQIDSRTNEKKVISTKTGIEEWLQSKADELNLETLDLPFQAFNQFNVTIGSGWLTTIAGRPKSGKSTMGLQIALETALKGKNSLFFSLEMSKNEVYNKSIAYLGSIPPTVVSNWGRDNELSKVSMSFHNQAFSKAIEKFRELNFNVFAESSTIWEILNIVKRENLKSKIDLIVIDQLSFIQTEGKFSKSTKVQEYDYIVRQLKMLARDLKIPIILLTQLNREVEKRGDEMPRLADIKDSGGIEETSDMIFLIHKKDEKASVYITSRHEAGGKFDLKWNIKLAKFED